MSEAGLEAHPKDLRSLVNIYFPRRCVLCRHTSTVWTIMADINWRLCDLRISAVRNKEYLFLGISHMDAGDTTITKKNKEDRDATMDERKIAHYRRMNPVVEDYNFIHNIIGQNCYHFDPQTLWSRSDPGHRSLSKKVGGVSITVARIRWCILAGDVSYLTPKPREINYGMMEEEVLSVLRIKYACYVMLVSREINVLNRYSTLTWLV